MRDVTKVRTSKPHAKKKKKKKRSKIGITNRSWYVTNERFQI